MSLYLGRHKIAGNSTTENIKADLSNYSLTFDDSGNIDTIDSFDLIQSQITDKSVLSSLISLLKTGQNYLNYQITSFTKEINAKLIGINNDLKGKYGINRLLTASDNLNELFENGIYWCPTISPMPANSPFQNAYILEIFGSGSNTSQKIQRATRYGVPGQSAFRPVDKGSTNIQKWTYNTEADITKITDANFDINTLITFTDIKPKIYYIVNQVQNFPWTNGWLICLPNTTGSNCSNKQIILRHGSFDKNNYMAQVRNYYSSSNAWSKWYSYTTNIDLQNKVKYQDISLGKSVSIAAGKQVYYDLSAPTGYSIASITPALSGTNYAYTFMTVRNDLKRIYFTNTHTSSVSLDIGVRLLLIQ